MHTASLTYCTSYMDMICTYCTVHHTRSHKVLMQQLRICNIRISMYLYGMVTHVTHHFIGNIAIFSKHFIGWSAAVKANTRTVGHDYNLVVAAEEQEQAHTSHMTNM